jgi:hypothetical protein
MGYGILVVVLKGWVLERMMSRVVLEGSVGVQSIPWRRWGRARRLLPWLLYKYRHPPWVVVVVVGQFV